MLVVKLRVRVGVVMERKEWECMLYSDSVLAPVKDVKKPKEL